MKLIHVIFLLLLVIVNLEAFKQAWEAREDKRVVETALTKLDVTPQLTEKDLKLHVHDDGIEILPLRFNITHDEVFKMLRDTGDVSGNFTYSFGDIGAYTMSSQNVDGFQYIVNAFLEGYEPLKVDNIFLPLYILSQRKSYMLDDQQYMGRPEVWQSSRQAFFYPRGDCEDHAIVLADWLIQMGEDARVVLGDYKGDGHAWVVVLKNGKEYLLESTQKSGLSRIKSYPLAVLHTEYHPLYMFNREYFWVNNGSKFTTDYSGYQWEMKSRYKLVS